MTPDLWQYVIYAGVAVATWLVKGKSGSVLELIRKLFGGVLGGGSPSPAPAPVGPSIPDDPNSILDDVLRLLQRLNVPSAPSPATPAAPALDRQSLRQLLADALKIKLGLQAGSAQAGNPDDPMNGLDLKLPDALAKALTKAAEKWGGAFDSLPGVRDLVEAAWWDGFRTCAIVAAVIGVVLLSLRK